MALFYIYQGEVFALATAVVWAMAVIFFKKSGESVHPLALNLFKNLLSILLLIPTMLFLKDSPLSNNTPNNNILFIVSGIMGIAAADTLFFISLNILGAGLTAILDCLYSPIVIFFAFFYLGERLSAGQYLGVVFITAAILIAVSKKERASAERGRIWLGITWGVLGLVCNAAGIVMIKPVLGSHPLVEVTLIRLVGGCLGLAVVLALYPRRQEVLRSLFKTEHWVSVIGGSFLGAYLAMILWLGGMKYTQTSIASALNQTANVLIFALAAVFLKEPLTWRRVLGILIAVGGVGLVVM